MRGYCPDVQDIRPLRRSHTGHPGLQIHSHTLPMSALGWTQSWETEETGRDEPDRNSREVFPTFSFLKLLPVLGGSLVLLPHVLKYPNNAEPLCKLPRGSNVTVGMILPQLGCCNAGGVWGCLWQVPSEHCHPSGEPPRWPTQCGVTLCGLVSETLCSFASGSDWDVSVLPTLRPSQPI